MTYANVTSRSSPNAMVALEGGSTLVGSLDFYPEEWPVRNVAIDPFRIDRCAVTNTRFAAFVDQTGYVAVAERGLNPVELASVVVMGARRELAPAEGPGVRSGRPYGSPVV